VPPLPSQLPLPPDELIDRVVSGFSNEQADEHRAMFLETGKRSLEDLERALLAIGDTIAEHERVLEFGCGCGRIMRWMEDLASTCTLVGTDIDARAIEWAAENLPFARFDVNEGLPPLRYDDGEFDMVINHSVFTHLDEAYQDLWLAELQRITAPGGILVLSVHGEHAFQTSERQLDPNSRELREWRTSIERNGLLYIAADSYVGSAFPDFYHTAFHAPWYVFEHWSRWFDVLAYLPRSSLDFQDQVILRRPTDSEERGSPVRARVGGESPPSPEAATAATSAATTTTMVEVPAHPSRFGPLGLAARRAVFRLARPVLHAQAHVDRSLAASIDALEARAGERMPPLVHIALRQQAERIDRLENDVQELRAPGGEDAGHA
jgi:SAM-dependent methyltransferase